jgi:hypothetical protein
MRCLICRGMMGILLTIDIVGKENMHTKLRIS